MSRLTLTIVGLILSVCPLSSYAQDEASGLLDVRTVTVKPNRAAEWESLQRPSVDISTLNAHQIAIADELGDGVRIDAHILLG